MLVDLKPILEHYDLSDFDIINKISKRPDLLDLIDARPVCLGDNRLQDYNNKKSKVFLFNHNTDPNWKIKILIVDELNYVALFEYSDHPMNYKNIPSKIIVSNGRIIRSIFRDINGINDFNGQPAVQDEDADYHYRNGKLHRLNGPAIKYKHYRFTNNDCYYIFGYELINDKKYARLINSVQTSSKKLLKLPLTNEELDLIYKLSLYYNNKSYAEEVASIITINKLSNTNTHLDFPRIILRWWSHLIYNVIHTNSKGTLVNTWATSNKEEAIKIIDKITDFRIWDEIILYTFNNTGEQLNKFVAKYECYDELHDSKEYMLFKGK